MGLANRAFDYSLMWRFENKRRHACISSSPVQPIFQMSKALGKKYKIFRIVEMGGNCMVEKYLMKLNSQNL